MASPSPEHLPGVREVVGEGTPLEPGRYSYSSFVPRVVFRLSEGWEGGHTLAEFFDVWHGSDMAQGFARPTFVAGPDGRVDAAGLSPSDAVAALSDIPSVEPILVDRARVDGRHVAGFVFTAPKGVELFGGPEGEFTAGGEGQMRIQAVDVRGMLVLLVTISLREPHRRHYEIADDLLDTVRFPT